MVRRKPEEILSRVVMMEPGCGIVFQFTLSSKTEKVLYKFCAKTSCPDGAGPSGMLARDSKGNLYGTTISGGAHVGGTVFKFDVSTSKESLLYSFCANTNCTDGEEPMGGLALNAKTGTLYGTTLTGGTGVCGQASGGGTLFQITTAGKDFDVLHDFSSSTDDGCGPWGTVVMDTAGNLYGTTTAGGDGTYPLGTVYKYSASGGEHVLYDFDAVDGQGGEPLDTLIYEKGALYGTTAGGGADKGCAFTTNGNLGGCGLVFKLVP
jgi:uncharacterized repeat protein (TIGR03803 family)